MIDEIGIVFPYARAEVLSMPVGSILRLYRRAIAHLEMLYGVTP